MNVDFINPFLTATINVLKKMTFIKPVTGKPFIKRSRLSWGFISSAICLTGVKNGIVVVSLSRHAAITIGSIMLYEQFRRVEPMIQDAMGELTNIIAGNARQALAEKGHVFSAGIPTILTGKRHKIKNFKKNKPILSIPFRIDNAPFWVDVNFD